MTTQADKLAEARLILESVGICINLEAVHSAIDKATNIIEEIEEAEKTATNTADIAEERGKALDELEFITAPLNSFSARISGGITRKSYETIRQALQQPAPEVVSVEEMRKDHSEIGAALYTVYTDFPNGVIVKRTNNY